MAKIEVRLNPDTPPTGSDLSVVNAARRSFNTRSEWEYTYENMTWETLEDAEYYFTSGDGVDVQFNQVKPTLKDKDKRLIEFLARGMTADDFNEFVKGLGHEVYEWEMVLGPVEGHPLVEKLWQWRNTPTHDTPFSHTFISFEVKAPIFVRAQLVKHEYLIMSEFSRRYITDGIEFYEPDYWRKAAPNKKQGSLEESVGPRLEEGCKIKNNVHNEMSIELYDDLIKTGVAPEQARMVLPQSTMTEWTWSGTLGAFAKMCQLRLHPEAQYEARLVAQEVYKHLKAQWPVSAPALVEGVL